MNPADMDKPSAIYPINIGITAPPATLITITEEAFSVLYPILLMPMAKMVGYMMDMKKYEAKMHITDVMPRPNTTKNIKIVFIRAYTPNSFCSGEIS